MKFLKLLFSRMVIVGLILALQVSWFIFALFRLGNYSNMINMIFKFISVLVVLYLINKDENPAYKIAWIIPILLVPLLGGILYLAIGNKKPVRKMRKKIESVNQLTSCLLYQKQDVLDEIGMLNKVALGQMKYLVDVANYPVYKNTDSKYFRIGEEYYEALLSELKKAKHYIFLEYFIVEEGEMWNSILEILEQKAKEGLDVRFMYDDVGCVSLLPYKYYQKLEEKGIKSIAINPFRPIFSVAMNNRDHRKIAVIDGHTGFTGGINLADEYINKKLRFGHWKDTGIMLRGEAVWSLTLIFLQMWNANRQTDSDYSVFFPHKNHKEQFVGNGYVLPYADSPLDSEITGENVYMNLINSATDYCYIYTPYLIIDNEMQTSLALAAKRGVDVRIITPGIPDKKLVFRVTRSYYPDLIKAGVKIYEYTLGFLHAKCIVVDDSYATVGSINFDYRSLFLHFELGVLLYQTSSVLEVKQDCLDTISKCKRMELSDMKQGFFAELLQAILRLFSPLL